MNCDDYGDDHVVHIKLKIDGEDHWVHWDEAEARASGFHSIFDDEPFPLVDIVASALENDLPDESNGENNPRCPECGLTFLRLLRRGRIGCAGCYTAFGKQMETLLRQLHGSTSHVGKRPGRAHQNGAGIAKNLNRKDSLKLELKKAIETEDYEQAARLRDKLQKLESVA